jgi:hypothetical protein
MMMGVVVVGGAVAVAAELVELAESVQVQVLLQ